MPQAAASFFRCLSDPTRLRILRLLAQGPLCVCHFQEILDQPQVSVSKHLAYLRGRGVVTAERQGQWMIYRIADALPEAHARLLRDMAGWLGDDPVIRKDATRLKSVRCGDAVARGLVVAGPGRISRGTRPSPPRKRRILR